MKRVLVWDVPTRLFHWLFATSFAIAWLTSENDQWLSVHTFFGYLMLGLIGFRLIWGVAGGHYARFTSFRYSPMAGLAYLRQVLSGSGTRYLGHNPAGSQAVYLLLALGLAVCITGLFTQGGEEQQGAAAGLMSIAAGRMVKEGHEITAILMLLLVFGHLAGVAVESWLHKENLPRSMVTGIKDAPEDAPASRPYRLTGAMMLVAVTAFGAWWFFYALHHPIEKRLGYGEGVPHVAFVGTKLPDNAQWREECGSCHLAFHPSLLPARSWQRMMAEQEKHFGTDLALDESTSKALLDFMVNNAAEKSAREAAVKINSSIKPEDAPLRITETPYWVKKHQDIAESDWRSAKVKSKVNCGACHQDAEAGTFEDAAMHIPR
ncbi:MAG: cytochrome b/b6 domain-containing protein [Nitrosomonadales bacterium]|nr:cytochrome b/b6 domain-containing protein [Nitrosomonadales bacterium]